MHYDNNHQCPAKMSERFNHFQRLPAEIRTMIWEYSLPEPRVYEVLDAPNAKQKTPAQKGLMFANIHPEPPPALALVCRESRYFVLHHYKPLTLGSTTKYVDLSRDILLLEPYLQVQRLHRTLHFMSQIPLIRDSINRLAFGTSYGVYTGICHPVLSWKVSKRHVGKLLAALAKFVRLKSLIFIVHQEFQFEFDFRHPQSSAIAIGSNPNPLPIPTTAPTPIYGGLVPLTPTGMPSIEAASPPLLSSQLPRPQLVHQAYRFKFDIEANINHTPRRPHLNELMYYPLEIDEDKDDFDLNDVPEGSEWCDPWPTNDDWRRFRRRFLKAIAATVEMSRNPQEAVAVVANSPPSSFPGWKKENTSGASDGAKAVAALGKDYRPPAIKGASLLWRYTRGSGFA